MNAFPPGTWTLTARWLFPVAGPPLERGVVAIADDRIIAVEPHGRLHARFDFGNAAILPGLVNAHTHLDLSGARNHIPVTGEFTDWLRWVIAYRKTQSTGQVLEAIEAGIAESLRHGTTGIGDISGDGGSWDLLETAPLRAVVFRELLGLTKDRASGAWERLDRWLASRTATPTCRPGVSPHAPYSVHSSLFPAASTRGVPVAVHLAETAAEQELLVLRRGPFVPFLCDLGVYDPEGLADDADHVLRLLNGASPTLVVHGNFLSPAAAIPSNASLVYCPRTHAAFGHPPHPFREFLARGVRVAVGTDSLASNPDLDVLAEVRFLHRLYPDIPGATLLRMATLSGAEALGWADETGSLAPGKSADLVVVPLPPCDDEPHRLFLSDERPVARVLFRGQWVFPA